jgi:hypothetical protein
MTCVAPSGRGSVTTASGYRGGLVVAPDVEYRARQARRAAEAADAARRARRVSDLRLGAFAFAAALGLAVWQLDVSALWLLVPLAGFVVLVVVHERVARRERAARRAEAHWAAGLRRLDGTWPGTGNVRTDFAPDDHPFAVDLDLFGTGSLFERLCTARTGAGVHTLAGWLLAPAEPTEVRARRLAVDELRPQLDLQEALALAGDALQGEVDPAVLCAWGERAALRHDGGLARVRAWAWGIVVANVAAIGWLVAQDQLVPLVGTALVTWVVGRRYGAFTRAIELGVERPARELALVADVLRRFEGERFTTARLADLRARLVDGPQSASARIRRLVRVVGWFEAKNGQLFAPVAFALGWGLHFGAAIERWRLVHGRELATWFAALGELEALAALASYAYERPGDVPADLVDGAPAIDADELGHPLLPGECVRNSIHLADDRRALVVSGSNMAGKSTYLRTIGVAVVLAQCGAPVFATRMRLTPLRIGATLRTQDSLQHGTSRFFAEITRLRRVMDIADEGPGLLFLLDEILHGTNSHDRRIGALAVVRNLLERGAIGLVTTHDLALTEGAGDLPAPVENVHFADVLEDGRLRFDYRLRPGVVRTSNALDLMRAIGLPL